MSTQLANHIRFINTAMSLACAAAASVSRAVDETLILRYKTIMTDVAALAVTAGATLLGVLIPTLATLWLTHESNTQTRLYRNHEKRVSIAEEYLRALDIFRRAIRKHADARGNTANDTYEAMVAAARNTADAGQLLRLYFDHAVHEFAERATGYALKMQQRAEVMSKNADDDHVELEQLDENGKRARDILIDSMKNRLGESKAGTGHRLWWRSAADS